MTVHATCTDVHVRPTPADRLRPGDVIVAPNGELTLVLGIDTDYPRGGVVSVSVHAKTRSGPNRDRWGSELWEMFDSEIVDVLDPAAIGRR